MTTTAYQYPVIAETTNCDDGSVLLSIHSHYSDTGHYRPERNHPLATQKQIDRLLSWTHSAGRHVGSCSSGVAGRWMEIYA
jgi:hypothetical protein